MTKLCDILEHVPILAHHGDLTVPITTIVYDSRRATTGSLFVALRGGYADGHDFLADAHQRGAVAAVVERVPDDAPPFTAFVVVPDTRAALAQLAAAFYHYPSRSLGIVGVTGTDGKTTTTFLTETLLRSVGHHTGLVGTVTARADGTPLPFASRNTTPESLELQALLATMRDQGMEWAVVEATSHGLVMHRLDEIDVDIAVVTNITHEHLDFHGTYEAYRQAKATLLRFAARRRPRPYPWGVVLNRDDAGAASIADAAGPAPVLWYSTRDPAAPIRASDIEERADGTRFVLHTPHGTAPVQLQLLGAFNVENALAAAGVGHLLDLDPATIAAGLGQLAAVPGRLQRIDCGQPFLVLVDYAHTPRAFERLLPFVRRLVPGRLIVVFGSAGERDRAKRGMQGELSMRLADFAIFTSEDPRFEDPEAIIAEIAAGAERAGGREGERYLRIEDRRAAIAEAMRRAQPGDAVLLLGKGHETSIIYGAEPRPWDEAAEARRALAALGYGREGA